MNARNFQVEPAKYRSDAAEFSRWRDAQRGGTESDCPSPTAELLEVVLLFLSDGYSSGNLAQRAVALVLLVRPDLMPGASYAKIADRLGCEVSSVKRCVRILREELPNFTGGGLASSQVSSNRRMALSQMRHRRRILSVEHHESFLLRLRDQMSPVLKKAAQDMRDFDIKLGLSEVGR